MVDWDPLSESEISELQLDWKRKRKHSVHCMWARLYFLCEIVLFSSSECMNLVDCDVKCISYCGSYSKKFFENHWVRWPEFWCNFASALSPAPGHLSIFQNQLLPLKCVLLTCTFGDKQSALSFHRSYFNNTKPANIYWTFRSTMRSAVRVLPIWKLKITIWKSFILIIPTLQNKWGARRLSNLPKSHSQQVAGKIGLFDSKLHALNDHAMFLHCYGPWYSSYKYLLVQKTMEKNRDGWRLRNFFSVLCRGAELKGDPDGYIIISPLWSCSPIFAVSFHSLNST